MSDWIVVDPANPPKLDPSTRVELYQRHGYSTKGKIAQFTAWQDIIKYRVLDTNPIQDLVTRAEEKHNPDAPLVGGKLSGDHYYRVEVSAPIAPELPPYTAECSDIIEALGMTFNEGEAFKAIWRLAAARQGRGKPGNEPQYDADKAAHYGGRIAVQTRKAKE